MLKKIICIGKDLMTMLFIWHRKMISVELDEALLVMQLDYSTAMFEVCCMVHFVASSYSTKSRSISIWYPFWRRLFSTYMWEYTWHIIVLPFWHPSSVGCLIGKWQYMANAI